MAMVDQEKMKSLYLQAILGALIWGALMATFMDFLHQPGSLAGKLFGLTMGTLFFGVCFFFSLKRMRKKQDIRRK
jgi:uncharacterized membrane protein YczE